MLRRMNLLGFALTVLIGCSSAEESDAAGTIESPLDYVQGGAGCELWAVQQDIDAFDPLELPHRLAWRASYTSASDVLSNLPSLGYSCTTNVAPWDALPSCPDHSPFPNPWTRWDQSRWMNIRSTVCVRGSESVVLTPENFEGRPQARVYLGCGLIAPNYVFRSKLKFDSSAVPSPAAGTAAVQRAMQTRLGLNVPAAGAFVDLGPYYDNPVSLSLSRAESEALVRELGATGLQPGTLPAFPTLSLPALRGRTWSRASSEACVQSHLPPTMGDGRSFHLCMRCGG